MNEKQVVVIDIDGVLAEFTYSYSTLAHKISDGNVPPAHSTGRQQTWDWDGQYSKQLMNACWRAIDESDSFWAELPLLVSYPEIEELQRLRDKVSIMYLTGRLVTPQNSVEDQTRYWLHKHGFPEGELCFATDKGAFLNSRGLSPLSVIDDKPETLNQLFDGGHRVFCRDWPYNRHLTEELPRVYSLGEWTHNIFDSVDTWYAEKVASGV